MHEIVRIRCRDYRYLAKCVSFRGDDLVMCAGEKVALIGANGSGKTTLLNCVSGMCKAELGSVTVFGVDPYREQRKLAGRVGVMLQNVQHQIVGPSVREDIALAPRCSKQPKQEVQNMLMRAAQRCAVTHLLDDMPHYLSGGEQKKVALAAALVTEPELLVLDEPLEGLDTRSRHEISRALSEYCTGCRSMLFSTHDFNLAAELADKVYLIGEAGQITEGDAIGVMQDIRLLERSGLEPPALAVLCDILRRGGVEVAFDPDPVRLGASLLIALFDRSISCSAGDLDCSLSHTAKRIASDG